MAQPPAPQPPEKPEPHDQQNNRDLGRYLSLGTQLAITVLLFVVLGWWLDRRYDWTPWGTLSLGSLGVLAGLHHFVKEAMR